MRTVTATRYVTPLREGGSLPALVEASDDGLYVTKLRGAGQGPKALVAEAICGEIARALGLPVPEVVLVELAVELSHAEPDPEIQELLQASAGTNLGLDFLPGSLPYTPAGRVQPSPELAADVVWFDALVENVDRSPRNPNLLVWHGAMWLIDHGAALYRQHSGGGLGEGGGSFPLSGQHVLLPVAGSIVEADERLAAKVDQGLLERVVEHVPMAWLDAAEPAEVYVEDLLARLSGDRPWVTMAEEARGGA
ncbi:HipA family kinase [Paraconexibacter sp.]|uniref:HipA family kinase n=1 Tax=Paraconexibacter sp. TaxID=2949640 RepID=UPI003562B1A1